MEERFEYGRNVAAAFEIGLGHAIDQALRWVIADEAHGKLAGDELGRRRSHGEEMEKLAALEFAILLELLAERLLCARLMSIGIELEASAALWAFDGPAGKDSRHLCHIRLCVAAIHTQSM